jgi:peptide/nickel transport system substrate-binding protein
MANHRDRELIKLVESFSAGELDRRSLVKRMAGLGAGAMFGGPLAALAMQRGVSAAPANRGTTSRSRYQNPAPVKGGTVIAAQIDKPVNMDPAFAELYSSMQVYQNIFGTLVNVDAAYNYTPGLAKTWTQVDPQTWEFDLVDNATFHNGEHITSADVAFTFERIFDPALAAPNAVFLQAIESVETEGDYKVRFKLKSPWGSFLADLAAAFNIVNEKGIASGDPRLNPVGTGPFKLTEWVQDDHVTLDRWENYHVPDRPYLDRVIFKAISDDIVRLTGLQTDELQWAMQVPLQKVDELKSDGGDIKVTVGKPYLPDFLYLNASKPPFNDARVRQAVAACVNRSEIVQVAFFGQAEEATEAIYSGNPLYTGINPWSGGPDPEKAKALLAEAGIDKLEFQLDGQPQVPTQLKTLQVLQQQLKSAGIETTIQNYDSGEWVTRLFAKEYSATVSYWSATLDPVHFYYPGLLSTSGWNVTGYGTPEMDEALNTFAQATEPEARKAAYAALIEKFNQEVPMVPLDNQMQQYWVRANVYGMEPLPTMEIRFEPVYIAE